MRRLALLIAPFVALGVSQTAGVHAASTSLTVQPLVAVANEGDQFTLDVVLSSDTPTRGIQFGMRFDPKVIQIDKVLDGTLYQGWAKDNGATATTAVPFKPDNSAGTVSVGGLALLGGAANAGPSGSGKILSLQLTAKSGVQGAATYLAYTSVIVSDASGNKLPSVFGAPAIVGVGVDPTSLPPPVMFEYRPAAPNVVDTSGDPSAGARVTVPTPDPIQSGILPTSGGAPIPGGAPTPAVISAPQASAQPATVATPLPTPTSPPPPTAAPASVAAPPPVSAPTEVPAPAVQPTQAPIIVAAQPPNQAVVNPTQGSVPVVVAPTSPPVVSQTGQVAATPQTAVPQAAAKPTAPAAAAPTLKPLAAAQQVIKPRATAGLFIPWELLAGVGGGIVSAGIVMFALNGRRSNSSNP